MIDKKKNKIAKIIVKYVKSFSTPRRDLYIVVELPNAVPNPPLLDCIRINITKETETIN